MIITCNDHKTDDDDVNVHVNVDVDINVYDDETSASVIMRIISIVF